MKKRRITERLTGSAIVCAAAVMLAACGGGQAAESRETAAETTAAAAEEEVGEMAAEGEAAAQEEAAAEAEGETAEPASDGPAAGVWDGSVYTDDYAEIRFTMPDGWVSLSEEDIAAAGGEAEDGFYSMMAVDMASGDNILMLYEDLSETAGFLAGAIDEKAYITSLRSQLADQNVVMSEEEPEEKIIGGNTYYCIAATMESDGVPMEQFYLVRKVESQMFCVIVTSLQGKSADDFIAMFE